MSEKAFDKHWDGHGFFLAMKSRFEKDGRLDERRCLRGASLGTIHLVCFLDAILYDRNGERRDAVKLLDLLERHNKECREGCRGSQLPA